MKKALYLAGGGARGAYQVGVMQALSEILNTKRFPFEVISGVSVGGINAAVLAENADDFSVGCEKLVRMWSNIYTQQIFNASNFALGRSVWRNVTNVFIKHRQSGYLLDTNPLAEFITQSVDFKKLEANIQANNLQFLEILSNCYETQRTVSFYQTQNAQFEDWFLPRHNSQKTIFGMPHLLASSALPIFFPTVNIDGNNYGDGGMGLISPLRGAIRNKVDKILIIGTRKIPVYTEAIKTTNTNIGFARTLGRILNNVFLDNLDRDIETVNHMNDMAALLSMWKKHRSPWRPIETFYLRPSADIGAIAQTQYDHMPTLLRAMLNALGAKSHAGDLLSFLLFEKEFTTQLINLGHEDTMAYRNTIMEFFAD